jgi:Skp family chaperone for outer membrane proteins
VHNMLSRLVVTLAAATFALLCIVALPSSAPAQQQGGQDYFMPNQRPAQSQRPAAPRAAQSSQPVQAPGVQPGAAPMMVEDQVPPNIPVPPIPDLPALPRGPSPPAAVIGVIGVPDVMRASTAAQQVDKVISERREKLNADAQKEQAAWREMQQQLANERAKLSPEQIRAKEHDLQDRITNAQRTFRDRTRIVQEAAQFAINQIQSSLIGVVRQVAESRGMNIILHRTQVALNANEFDITQQVTEQLNKILPAVNIPPEGVSPVAAKTPVATPATATAPAKPAAPAPAKK